MKKFILIVGFYLAALFAKAQVIDFDGNIYDTVLIGNQIWLKQNIKSLHYSDGTLINPSGVLDYNNDPALGNIYGKLYVYSAAMRGQVNGPTQGVCPNGYRLADDTDWGVLGINLGGDNGAGRKLKDTVFWQQPNDANNSTGFSALPSGKWDNSLGFNQLLYAAWFWSGGNSATYFRYLTNTSGQLSTYSTSSGINDDKALSCRCVKNYNVGLPTKPLKAEFNIFPNPATNKLLISFERSTKELPIKLSDLLGREILSSVFYNTSTAELNLTNVTEGVYILTMQVDGKIINEKIIVQH